MKLTLGPSGPGHPGSPCLPGRPGAPVRPYRNTDVSHSAVSKNISQMCLNALMHFHLLS